MKHALENVEGKKIAVIVNDLSEVNVDANLVKKRKSKKGCVLECVRCVNGLGQDKGPCLGHAIMLFHSRPFPKGEGGNGHQNHNRPFCSGQEGETLSGGGGERRRSGWRGGEDGETAAPRRR